MKGRIVRADSMQVEMAVETAEDVRGKLARWGGERFTIPREGINSVIEKKVSKKRTWLLVGGIAVGIVSFFLGIKAVGTGGSEGGA